LGDRIFEPHVSLGALAVTRSRFARPVDYVGLEIVGIYTNSDNIIHRGNTAHHSYSAATVFLPLHLLPASADTANTPVKPGAFSFVVQNARNGAAFLREAQHTLGATGLLLTFDDGGWMDIEREFTLTQRISLIAITVLVITTAAVAGFVVFLFILQKKRDFAIMRATGCSQYRASFSLFLPLLTVAVLAVVAGGCAAWVNSSAGIAAVLSEGVMAEYSGLDASVSPQIAFGIMLGLIGFVCVMACYGLWRVSKYKPLALLQGGIKQKVKRKVIEKEKPILKINVDIPPVPEKRGNPAPRHVIIYIFRNIRSSAIKSTLSLTVAVIILIAGVQFAVVREAARELYTTMPVVLALTGEINRVTEPDAGLSRVTLTHGSTLVWIEFSGLVRPDPYLLSAVPSFWIGNVRNGWYQPFTADEVWMAGRNVEPVFTNDIERYLGVPAEIEWYDGTLPQQLHTFPIFPSAGSAGAAFWSHRGFVFLSGDLMDALDVGIGDWVYMIRGEDGYRFVWDGRLFVLGRVDYEADTPDYKIFFMPRMQNIWTVDAYTYAEYILADNTRAKELRALVDRFYWQGFTYVLNTDELDRVGTNLALYDMFFPYVITALALTGGLLPGLIIMQSSKEAALLRSLGTAKSRVRVMLAGHQLILCFAGFFIGGLALLVNNGTDLLFGIKDVIFICAGFNMVCFITAALVCAFAVSRKKVLELLQTKE
jgi:hypothetical protein